MVRKGMQLIINTATGSWNLRGHPSEYAEIVGLPDYSSLAELRKAVRSATSGLLITHHLEGSTQWSSSGKVWQNLAEWSGSPEARTPLVAARAFARIHGIQVVSSTTSSSD